MTKNRTNANTCIASSALNDKSVFREHAPSYLTLLRSSANTTMRIQSFHSSSKPRSDLIVTTEQGQEVSSVMQLPTDKGEIQSQPDAYPADDETNDDDDNNNNIVSNSTSTFTALTGIEGSLEHYRSEQAIYSGLTETQKRIVDNTEGPMMLLSGPGTGKTHAICRRIYKLIMKGTVKPSEILVLTSTESAASLIQQKLDISLPMGYNDTRVKTFYSFCVEVLQNNKHIALEDWFSGNIVDSTPDINGFSKVNSNQVDVMNPTEQIVFIRKHLFDLPLKRYRPLGEPTRCVHALASLFNAFQRNSVSPADYLDFVYTKVSELEQQAQQQLQQQGSGASRRKIKPNEIKAADFVESHTELAAAFTAYTEIKRRENKMDPLDPLHFVLRLLREHPSTAADIKGAYKYVLVDQFEDITPLEWDILKLLVESHHNLLVAGDDDEGAFEYREGTASHVLFKRFMDTFPNASIISMNDNFRIQSSTIATCAQRLVARNKQRLETELGLSKPYAPALPADSDELISNSDDDVQYLQFENVLQEAEGIGSLILPIIEANKDRDDCKIGVLTRSNADAIRMSRLLRQYGQGAIPHVECFSGEPDFYDRPEIKLLMSFLACSTAPLSKNQHHPDQDLFNLITSKQVYDFPIDDLAKITHIMQQQQIQKEYSKDAATEPLYSILSMVSQGRLPGYSDKARAVARSVVDDLSYYNKMIQQRGKKAAPVRTTQLILAFLKRCGLYEHYMHPTDQNTEEEAKNIAKFLKIVDSAQKSLKLDKPVAVLQHLQTLRDFGSDISKRSEEYHIYDHLHGDNKNSSGPSVLVMTIHKAKGFEFDYVFLAGCTDDQIPGNKRKVEISMPQDLLRSGEADDGVSERERHIANERKLVYVALSRARRKFFFTCPTLIPVIPSQEVPGAASAVPSGPKPSRFIAEALGLQTTATGARKQRQYFIENVLQDLDLQPTETEITLSTNPTEKIGTSELHTIPSSEVNDADDSSAPPMLLSVSRIDEYHRCPLRYKYSHVLGLPSNPTAEANYGSAMRGAVLQYVKYLINNNATTSPNANASTGEDSQDSSQQQQQQQQQQAPQPKLSPAELITMLQETFKNNWSPVGFLNEQHEKEGFAAGLQDIEAFLNRELKKQELPLSPLLERPRPIFSEKPFELSINIPAASSMTSAADENSNSGVVKNVKSQRVLFRGVWDRIDVLTKDSESSNTTPSAAAAATGIGPCNDNDDNKEIILTEYKSRMSMYRLKKAETQLQLVMHAYAYEQMYGKRPARAILESIDTGDQLVYVPTDKDKILAERVIAETARAIQRQQFEARPSYKNCKTCSFRNICPHVYKRRATTATTTTAAPTTTTATTATESDTPPDVTTITALPTATTKIQAALENSGILYRRKIHSM